MREQFPPHGAVQTQTHKNVKYLIFYVITMYNVLKF